MQTKALDQILGQMRTAAAMAAGAGTRAPAETGNKNGDFASVLEGGFLDQANGIQQQATKLARDFETGAPDVSLPDVMVSIQKANVSFQQVVQVRNKLVAAYHDIMNSVGLAAGPNAAAPPPGDFPNSRRFHEVACAF